MYTLKEPHGFEQYILFTIHLKCSISVSFIKIDIHSQNIYDSVLGKMHSTVQTFTKQA